MLIILNYIVMTFNNDNETVTDIWIILQIYTLNMYT